MSVNKIFGTDPCSFIYELSVAHFFPQENQVVTTETIWLTKFNVFIMQLFIEKVCLSLI